MDRISAEEIAPSFAEIPSMDASVDPSNISLDPLFPSISAMPTNETAATDAVSPPCIFTPSSLPADPPTIFPQRSTSPVYDQSRTDPFQFGSRYLTDASQTFKHNAWDHVETDDAYKAHAAAQYAFQRAHAVAPFDARRFNSAPEKWWDRFYGNNEGNFFKDRKWLRQEFPILEECTRAPSASPPPHIEESLATSSESSSATALPPPRQNSTILEVGAGAGNTAFPLLAHNHNPNLLIHATDFSKKAIDLITKHPLYNHINIRAQVWDISSASSPLPPTVSPGSIDVVLLIFIFSALSPSQWAQAVRNIYIALRPGGEVCFRDYGRGDLAQVRFKKGRLLGENFYVRGDGTRVYFFEVEELRGIWGGRLEEVRREAVSKAEGGDGDGNGEERTEGGSERVGGSEKEEETEEGEVVPAFEIVSLGVDRRLLVNRQKQLKMYRCWMQGRFRKPMLDGAGGKQSASVLADVPVTDMVGLAIS